MRSGFVSGENESPEAPAERFLYISAALRKSCATCLRARERQSRKAMEKERMIKPEVKPKTIHPKLCCRELWSSRAGKSGCGGVDGGEGGVGGGGGEGGVCGGGAGEMGGGRGMVPQVDSDAQSVQHVAHAPKQTDGAELHALSGMVEQ